MQTNITREAAQPAQLARLDAITRALIIAIASALVGTALAVAGVYVLLGLGWALIASALVPFGTAIALLRGSKHAS
jgi:hypothetical protein